MKTKTMERATRTRLKETKTTTRMNGSHAVIQSLIAEGVEMAFGYPGGAIMPIYDAMYDYRDKFHHVLTRHEQGATHSAQGYARSSGKVGVCFATSGPGATNLITGIADAQIDSTPMVCITGQVASHLLGTDAFQETDVIGISMPVTKWNFQVTSAEEIPEAIAKAFFIARSGRPGPVLIDITKNAQIEEFDYEYEPCKGIPSYVGNPHFDGSKVQEAAKLMNEAKKPMIVFGQGVLIAEAEQELKKLIEHTGIPTAWTIMGLSGLPTDHPLNVGMVGMHGNYAPNILTNECDLLIAIGMRFDDRVTGRLDDYARNAKVIHLEIDKAEIDKNVKTDVALLGDCKETMNELMYHLKPNSHEEWREEFKKYDKMEYDAVIADELTPKEGQIKMGEVMHRLNQHTNDDALVVTDVGQHQMIACRYAKFKSTRSMITSGGLGTMGFCLPAAIGAKLATPERTVVGVIGDGSFQMTLQEMGTILQTQVDVKIIIMNNEFLGMVRQWQELFFDKRYSATEMVNPDFQTITKGYGIACEKISERGDLDAAIQRMLNHEGSYLLEVVVGKEDNVFPMIATGESVSDMRLQ